MELKDLKHHLQSNKVRHLYIFSGEELGIKNKYIGELISTLKVPVVRSFSYQEVASKISAISLFETTPTLYIIYNDDFIIKENINIVPSRNYVILVFNDIDKRSKYYKSHRQEILEFNKISTEILTQKLKIDYKITIDKALRLISYCDNDYARILSEIDKIQSISEDMNSGFDYIEPTIYKQPQGNAFQLVDAILKKEYTLVYTLLKDYEKLEESNIALLTNLYNTTKQVLQVQNCKSKNISQITGINPYVIKHLTDKLNIWSNAELLYIMKTIQQVDTNIKKGVIDEEISVRYALSLIFR